MTTLSQLVSPHLDKTDAEIVAMLNAPSVQYLNTTRYDWIALRRIFPPENVDAVSAALEAAPGKSWVQRLVDEGRDLSTDDSQSIVESLRATIGDAFTDALLWLGRRMVSPYQNAGFEGEATLEEVAEIHADLITRRDAGAYWSRVLAVVNPMIDAGNTAAEIKTAAAGVE